jgi:hypothetical protein
MHIRSREGWKLLAFQFGGGMRIRGLCVPAQDELNLWEMSRAIFINKYRGGL